MRVETRVLPFNDDAIAKAARLILAGDPVAIATEKVYGLAADASDEEAVARISPPPSASANSGRRRRLWQPRIGRAR